MLAIELQETNSQTLRELGAIFQKISFVRVRVSQEGKSLDIDCAGGEEAQLLIYRSRKLEEVPVRWMEVPSRSQLKHLPVPISARVVLGTLQDEGWTKQYAPVFYPQTDVGDVELVCQEVIAPLKGDEILVIKSPPKEKNQGRVDPSSPSEDRIEIGEEDFNEHYSSLCQQRS